jgi:hypothetical protein
VRKGGILLSFCPLPSLHIAIKPHVIVPSPMGNDTFSWNRLGSGISSLCFEDKVIRL